MKKSQVKIGNRVYVYDRQARRYIEHVVRDYDGGRLQWQLEDVETGAITWRNSRALRSTE